MTSVPLLSLLPTLGIRVRPNGGNLTLSPRAKLTPDLVDQVRTHKSALLQELSQLQRAAGRDWEEIVSDPKQLKAFYELSMITEMRARAIVPKHYTSVTRCRSCGPVPIFEECPPEVQGCPWCFNRVRGLPMPKPETLATAEI